MIDTYWDFYIIYIDKCVRENDANGLDPEHYYMEWNHWLPKCLFKGHGPGQWLTLQQHAIASALQTLGLRENCMTGMMKKYLPDELLKLAWPYYCLAQSERMSGELHPMFGKTGELHPNYGKKFPEISERMSGELNPMFGEKRPDLSERNRKRKGELNPMFGRTGELHPMYGKKNPGASAAMKLRTGELNTMYGKTGELHPMFGKKNPALSESNKKRTGELHPNFGTKWWVNSEGETYKGVEAPGPEWQNGRKWRFTP